MNHSILKDYFIQCVQSKTFTPANEYLGIEYEKFVILPNKTIPGRTTYRPLPTEGFPDVEQLLNNYCDSAQQEGHFYQKKYENHKTISIIEASGQSLTIEPGGQIELSDAPRQTLASIEHAIETHLRYLSLAISPFSGSILFHGVQPLFPLSALPMIGKKRYHIMFPYMKKVGTHGQLMMKATAGAQVSIDYFSIEDLERKFVLLNRLAPFLTAMFANSPLYEGKPTGYKSFRSRIWRSTDSCRAGIPLPFLEPTFQLQDYIDWALKAPPYYLQRNGEMLEMTHSSFAQLMEGVHPQIQVTPDDWAEHLGMLFPEIRIKKIIEVRAIDTVPPEDFMAIPALIQALVYNESVFEKIQSRVMEFPLEDYPLFLKAAAREGLQAEVNWLSFSKMVIEMTEWILEALGSEGEHWLLPFFEKYTKNARTPADQVLENYQKAGRNANKWLEREIRARP
ncbi:glutamate-cysteine ligase family protein [Deltaproteobacteria bacterium TL4]